MSIDIATTKEELPFNVKFNLLLSLLKWLKGILTPNIGFLYLNWKKTKKNGRNEYFGIFAHIKMGCKENSNTNTKIHF